jgi:hypothetical protein
MLCLVKKIKDFKVLLEEITKDYDPKDYTPENREYVFGINRAWGKGTLLIDSYEPFNTPLKLYYLLIIKGKGLIDDDSCRCLVLEYTTEEPRVFKRYRTLYFFYAAHNINTNNG